MFADVASIEVRAGKGGDGRLSFRHEKYRAHGGPDGGDGGRGGDVVAVASHNADTLTDYRTARLFAGGEGEPGGGNRRHGKNGLETEVKVPVGTQIWEGEVLVADLIADGQRAELATGGRGGFGNAHFVSSVRQAPRSAELGEPGQYRRLRLELKLAADVGMIGLPNAGKSTLLSVISAARPQIGDYAFTTLTPNLGMVEHRGRSFAAADIPGLIEGASQGKGLGDEFLRHVERTAVLLHLVDAGSADPAADWRTVDGELAAYGHGLADRPQLAVLTKSELVTPDELAAKTAELEAASGRPVLVISAQTHQGLPALLDAALKLVTAAREQREREAAAAAEALPVIDQSSLPAHWTAEPDPAGGWRVSGAKLEGFARRTDVDQPDAVTRLRDILRREGVDREMRRLGAVSGDLIHIGEREIIWLG